MAIIAPVPITVLPTVPVLSDISTFSSRTDAFINALPEFRTDTNDIATNVYNNALEAQTHASTSTAHSAIATAQAGIATTQASNAAADAAAVAIQAADVLDMDKRYLGSKASPPTLDNQGAALQTGAVYYDTTLSKVMTWNGSAWVEGIASVSGVTSVNGSNGAVTLKTVNSESIMGAGDIAIPPSNVQTLTATGTLTDGMAVALRSDGTVEPVVQTVAVAEAIGALATFASVAATQIKTCFDSANNRVVAVYRNGDDAFGYAVVGTISGTSITWGTPVVFHNTNNCPIMGVTFDSTNSKVVIGYTDSASILKAVVGTVSGTSISFGTVYTQTAIYALEIDLAFDSTNGKVIVCYRNNSGTGRCRIGTVSGTTITLAADIAFEASTMIGGTLSVAYNATLGNFLVAYNRQPAATNYVHFVLGTVSGTTSSFSASVATSSYATTYPYLVAYGGMYWVSYRDDNGGTPCHALRGITVSGGTPVLTTSNVIGATTSPTTQSPMITQASNGIIECFYYDSVAAASKYRQFNVTTQTFGTATTLESAAATYMAATYSSMDGVAVVAYLSAATTGKSAVYRFAAAATTNANNFIGISKSAVTNAAAQIATLGAKVTNQSGLTPNALYYLTDTGTLSTTPNNRKIGKATAATDLIIDTDDVSSGAWVLLSTVTAAGSSTVDIEQTFSDAFDEYVITGTGITTSASATMLARVKVSGAYVTSTSYLYNNENSNSSSAAWAGSNSTGTSYIATFTTGSSTGDVAHATIYISQPASTNRPVLGWFARSQAGAVNNHGTGGGHCTLAGPMTGLRFIPGSGVILSGTFRLYGIKK